jgi:ribose/xylose/arabinose/galactoside ABC-type transport system permease subunit
VREATEGRMDESLRRRLRRQSDGGEARSLDARVFVQRYGIALVLLVEVIVWSLASPEFLTANNLLNVARQSSVIGISAVGMTFCMIAGSIDLSVASMLAFSGMFAAIILQATGSAPLAWLVPTGIGALVGCGAGLLITRLKLSAFIVTLALFAILGAGALLVADGYTVPAQDPAFRSIGIGYLGPIPVPVVLLAVALVSGQWALSNTPFGRRVYAVGGNAAAARYAGVRVNVYIVAVHALVAGATAFAGVVLAARLGSGTPNAGSSLLLDIIAGVIIGGTSVFGGVGTMWGTMVGILILAFLRDGLTLIDVAGYWQTMATGLALLGAVILDRLFYAQARSE